MKLAMKVVGETVAQHPAVPASLAGGVTWRAEEALAILEGKVELAVVGTVRAILAWIRWALVVGRG